MPIEEVEREYGVRGAIKMASNENALGPSPKAVAAIKRSLGDIHRYPDGANFYLRKKLSVFLKVRPETLVFGNGSDELLALVVRAFVGPGDEVIIADPTFLIYEIATTMENGVIVKVPMKDFRYDLEGMARKIGSRTKLMFIANPDNPVGTYVTAQAMSDLMKRVPKEVVVVLDEAYYEFACDRKDYPDSLKLLKQHKNILVTRTFSKAYGLSGLRIGYGIADLAIVNTLNKVREPFNVNLLAQRAALAALDDKAHLTKTVRMVKEGRAYLEKEFKRLRLYSVPTATNFMLVNLERDARPVVEDLIRKGIIVRPMSAWGMKEFIRVTIGKVDENRKFTRELKKIMFSR